MRKTFVYIKPEWIPIKNTSISSKFYFRDDRNDATDAEIREIRVSVALTDLIALGLFDPYKEEQPTANDRDKIKDMMFSTLTHFIERGGKFPLGDELHLKETMIDLSKKKNEESLRSKYTITVDI